jgi:opacity protein-like surface antigen
MIYNTPKPQLRAFLKKKLLPKNKFIVILSVIVFNISSSISQNTPQGLGVQIGNSIIHSDYGEGNSSDVNALSVSLTHSLYFFGISSWRKQNTLNHHIALRSELNFVSNIKLSHKGEYVNGNGNLATQLRAMTGSFKITNIGFQGEIYLKNLKEFIYYNNQYGTNLNPYLLAGIQFSIFKNSLNSTLGDWTQDSSVLPEKWRDPSDTSVGRGTSFSSTFGLGTRYKLNNEIDLNAQFKWQFFFSDNLDGLRSNSPENEDNEWSTVFQIGFIYNLF